jgi:DNA-binding transcriptional MerR regulator
VKLKQTYSSREVAARTGLTARQLQVWDASGLISPAIGPHRTAAGGYTERRYTPIDLFELLVLAELRRQGFSIPQLHRLQQVLHDQFGARLFEATGGGGGVQLLTDGRDIYARTDRGEVFNVLKTPAQPLLVVGEEGLLKELSSSLRPRRRRKASSPRPQPAGSSSMTGRGLPPRFRGSPEESGETRFATRSEKPSRDPRRGAE